MAIDLKLGLPRFSPSQLWILRVAQRIAAEQHLV
jgi:hypothetical protein